MSSCKNSSKLILVALFAQTLSLGLISEEIADSCDGRVNILGSSIKGSWELDEDLAKALGSPKKMTEFARGVTVEFKDVNSRYVDLSYELRMLSDIDKCFYAAGEYRFGDKGEGLFAVISLHGNSAIALAKKGGTSLQGFMLANMAFGGARVNDILFLGGADANEAMVPLKRVSEMAVGSDGL